MFSLFFCILVLLGNFTNAFTILQTREPKKQNLISEFQQSHLPFNITFPKNPPKCQQGANKVPSLQGEEISSGKEISNFCFPKTDYNSLNRTHGDDGSMVYYSQSPGYAVMIPNAKSYWYTLVNKDDSSCLDTTKIYGGLNAIILRVNAPKGSSFRISLTQKSENGCLGTDQFVFLNSSFYTTFENEKFQNLVIPLDNFSGFIKTNLKAISISNFYPLESAYEIAYVSFVAVAKADKDRSCPFGSLQAGIHITDFCDPRQFANSKNAFLTTGDCSDDRTMEQYFSRGNYPGFATILPNKNSYWYTSINGGDSKSCFDASLVYDQGYFNALEIGVRAPIGSNFSITISQSPGSSCSEGHEFVSVNSRDFVQFRNDKKFMVISIPFQKFKGIKLTNLKAIILTKFSPILKFYDIAYASFTYTAQKTNSYQSSACPLPPGLAITNFCNQQDQFSKNLLNGAQSDDGTMEVYETDTSGVATLVPKDANSYWRTVLGEEGEKCYGNYVEDNGVMEDVLNIGINAPKKSSFKIKIVQALEGCGEKEDVLTLDSESFVKFSGKKMQEVSILLRSLKGINLRGLKMVYLTDFSEFGEKYNLSYVSLSSSI